MCSAKSIHYNCTLQLTVQNLDERMTLRSQNKSKSGKKQIKYLVTIHKTFRFQKGKKM